MRTLVLADIGLYAGLGALEVALPAVAAREGAAAAAALPLAAFAAASAVASLVYGTRPAPPGRRYVLGSLALDGGVPAAGRARDGLGARGRAASRPARRSPRSTWPTYALLDVVAPEGTGAEALTWLTTAGAAGTAAGAALAGRARGRGEPRGRAGAAAVGAALALACGGGADAGR